MIKFYNNEEIDGGWHFIVTMILYVMISVFFYSLFKTAGIAMMSSVEDNDDPISEDTRYNTAHPTGWSVLAIVWPCLLFLIPWYIGMGLGKIPKLIKSIIPNKFYSFNKDQWQLCKNDNGWEMHRI